MKKFWNKITKKATKKRNDERVIIDENQDYYLKDKDGNVHYVVLSSVFTEGGKLGFEYSSSSDLEKRNLLPSLEEMVKKIYVDGEIVDDK